MTHRKSQGLAVGAEALLLPALALAQDPIAPAAQQMGMAIAIAGMICGTIFVLGVLGLSFFYATRRDRDRHELIERLVEKGQPVPRELFGKAPLPLPPHEQQRVDFRRGVVLLGWGCGIALLMYFGLGILRAAAWGLLFLCLSVASFVNAYLSARAARRGP